MPASAPPPKVVLYAREECHLCDAVRQAILPLRDEIPFDFEEVDVDTDAGLAARYGHDVPVVTLDGREIARHRMTREELRAFLGQTPPRRP